jgi:hypothetical protein
LQTALASPITDEDTLTQVTTTSNTTASTSGIECIYSKKSTRT